MFIFRGLPLKYIQKFACLLTVVFLTSCAIEPIHFDGKSATYQHDSLDFAPAMTQAKAKCKEVNKGIKHESTSCSPTRKCVSTFICIAE